MKKLVCTLLVCAVIGAGGQYFFAAETIESGEKSQNRLAQRSAQPSNKRRHMTQFAVVCTPDTEAKIDAVTRPIWQSFKDRFYEQGVSQRLLQMAISEIEPLRDSNLLQTPPLSITSFGDSSADVGIDIGVKAYEANLRSAASIPGVSLNDVMKTLISSGIQGVVDKVDSGLFPDGLLTNSSGFLVERALAIGAATGAPAILPSSEELVTLVSYGYEVSMIDYLVATKNAVPLYVLEDLVALGPSPEAANYRFPTIPIDIAAQAGNLAFIDFWLENGLVHNSRFDGRNYADRLLLNVSDTEELDRYWQFLKDRSQFPRDPITAEKLLSDNNLDLQDDLRIELEMLVFNKGQPDQLDSKEQEMLDLLVQQIFEINQDIQSELNGLGSCLPGLERS